MDPHHTFLRVHARLSGMLAQLLMPRNRSSLRLAIVLLGVLTVMHVNFVAQAGYANELSGSNFNELSGSNISESQLLQIKLGYANELQESNISECQLVPLKMIMPGNQLYEGLLDDVMMQNHATCPNPNPAQNALDQKDEGTQDDEMMQKDERRQDDEMMENQATRANPNPAEKAGLVDKVKEKLPGCQTQSQTGQNQNGKSQTQTLTQSQTQIKTLIQNQDDEMIGCQTQSQTGQTQTGKAQRQEQTQAQRQEQTQTPTVQFNQTETQTV
uniref:Uncharacterized protein n=1 Tax=Picea sitchensis TaxID=3332 RepID=A9NW80_PICSI|nr:unknown [Picea sitchensis]